MAASVLALVGASLGTACQAQSDPEMEDLGSLGGDYVSAIGISADGAVVVGLSSAENGKLKAFRWVAGATGEVSSNPQMYKIGSLGRYRDHYWNPTRWSSGVSVANAVNADGTVVVGDSRKLGTDGVRWEIDDYAFR